MADRGRLFSGATPVKGAGKLDYHAIVAGAIAALHDPSAEARQAVYEHARRVVLDRLRASVRSPSAQHLADEKRALERAIAAVEAKAREPGSVDAQASAGTATPSKPAIRRPFGLGAHLRQAAIASAGAFRRAIAVIEARPRQRPHAPARVRAGAAMPRKPAARVRMRIDQAVRWSATALLRAIAVVEPEIRKLRRVPARVTANRAVSSRPLARPRLQIGHATAWSVVALAVVGIATTFWLVRARLSDLSLARSRQQVADIAARAQAPVAFGPPPGCNAILAATDLTACANAATERHEAGVDQPPDRTRWLSASTGLPQSQPQPAPPAPAAVASAAPAAPTEPVAGPTARARELTESGIRLAKDGDLDQALRELTQAVRADPLYADAYVHRGQTLFKLGDTEHALVDLNEAIRLDPRNAPAWRARGMTLLYKGDEDAALNDLSKAIQLTEADPTRMTAVDLFYAHRIRASLCEKRKLYDREIYDLSAMIDAYWKDPLLADALRTSYREAGVASLIGSVYRMRANAHVRKGSVDLAISDISFAVQLDPQRALPLLLERARLQETLGRREQAMIDFQHVLELTPANEEAKTALTRLKSQASLLP
jgi:tetratricopeptide (TPR) repeat protein